VGKAAGGGEADYSPPSSAEVKCVALYLHYPNTPSCRGALLKKSIGKIITLQRNYLHGEEPLRS